MYRILLSLFAFILFINPKAGATNIFFHQPYTDTNLCAGNTLIVQDSLTGSFSAGNTFTVQLSDASGSFASPVNIGSVTAMTAGNISCTIPSGTTTGAGYRVRIVASNPVDTSADNGINIHISRLPTPSTISTNSPVCVGDSLYINAANTTGGVSYSWAGPNNISSTLQNLSATHAVTVDSGIFHLTTSLGACSRVDSILITVKPLPSHPSFSSNSPVCAGDSLHFYATDSTPGIFYSWTGPNSFNTTFQNPSIANVPLSDSGLYHLSVNLNGCIVHDSVDIMVKYLPGVPNAASNAPVCVGDSLHLNATDTSASASFFWYGPGSFSASQQNPGIGNVVMSDTGFYFVTAILNGCFRSASIHVSLNVKPSMPSIVTNSPLCGGGNLSMIANDSTTGVTYQWMGPNSFSSTSQSPTKSNVQIADSGLYRLVAILGNCVSDTASSNFVVNPVVVPSVSIVSNPSPIIPFVPTQLTAVIVNGGSTPAIQWRRNGLDIPGYIVSPTILTLADTDVITIFIQSSAPCASPDTALSSSTNVGVGRINVSLINIKIYPNPAKGQLYIDAPVKIRLHIVSIDGKTLLNAYTAGAHDLHPIDVSKLASATYMILVLDESGAMLKTAQFVKQ